MPGPLVSYTSAVPDEPSDVQHRAIERARRRRRLVILQNAGLAIIALGVAVLVYIAATR